MRRMVLKTGQFPRILILDDITRLSPYPILGGGFADIWQGKLSDGTKVALKVLRLFSNTEEEKARINKVSSANILTIEHILIQRMKEFHSETIIWSQLHHPNILPFLGVCTTLFEWRPTMVTPWMERGNALNYMSKTPAVDKFILVSGLNGVLKSY